MTGKTLRPGLLILSALLVFAPLARASVQDWAVVAIHMFTVAGAGLFLAKAALRGGLKWVSTPLDVPVLCLSTLVVAATAFSITPGISLWSTLLALNYAVVFYWTVQAIQTRSGLRALSWTICAVALLVTAIGFVKLLGNNPFPWREYTDLEPTGCFTSTYGNRNHLAGFMEMAVPMALGLCLAEAGRARAWPAVYVSLGFVAALVLSLSRGGWTGASIGFLFMAACLFLDQRFLRKAILATVLGVGLAGAIVALSSRSVVERILTVSELEGLTGFGSRLAIWGAVLDMIGQRPLLGTGPGTFAFAFTQYQPPGFANHFRMAHNDYLQFAAEAGLPVLIVVAWMAFAVYRQGFRKLRHPSRLVRGTTLGALGGITAILVHSLFDFNLRVPANALFFAVLCAIAAAPPPRRHPRLLE